MPLMNDWFQQQVDREITRWRTTPPGVLLYLIVAVLASLYLVPTFEVAFGWQMLTLAIVLIGTGLYRLWLVPLMLLLVMTNLVITEEPIYFGPYFGLYHLLMALAVLTFVVAASRYAVLAGTPVAYYQGSLMSRMSVPIRRILSRIRSQRPKGVEPRDPATFRATEVVTAVIRIVLAVIVAAAILSTYRLDPTIGQRTGIIPTVTRTIELGVTLVIAGIVIHFVIDTLCWRFLSAREARMFLRNEVTSEYGADLARMARYQVKGRKKVAARSVTKSK